MSGCNRRIENTWLVCGEGQYCSDRCWLHAIRAAARELLEALPRCEDPGWADRPPCREVATRRAFRGLYCDFHNSGRGGEPYLSSEPLPYAAAVRKLREVLG